MADSPPSTRTTLRRHRERGAYDRPTVERILDEALVCHVGVVSEGSPVVLPTLHVRVGDDLYLHGARANAMFAAAIGNPVCVTVTLLDGLVLARSHFHHSVNYRSVVVFGTAVEVEDPDEKRAALAALVDHVAPGQAAAARPPDENELRTTLVLKLPLEEVSAKVRTGGPVDDEGDLGLPVWAGVLPLRTVPGEPVPDVDGPAPDHVTNWGKLRT